MRPFANFELLTLWENARDLHPIDQGLQTLAVANPDLSFDEIVSWPIGNYHRALAELQNICFGPTFRGWTVCEECAEKLEFEIDCATFTSLGLLDGQGDLTITAFGHPFRLPSIRDMVRVAGTPDLGKSMLELVESCRLDGNDPVDWSDGEVEEIGEKMSVADPLAETSLSFHCPACGLDWTEVLNVAAFVWAEIETRARRLMLEVHTLAAAYGWSEREILSLSGARRGYYVELVQR